MGYLGDYTAGGTIDFSFTTVDSTGAPAALSGGVVSVYKDSSTTQSTAGVTLTASFDAVTGLNHVTITTTSDGTFYGNGSQFEAIITTGTVSGVSVVGYVVGRFTLRAQAALYPTTAGGTLTVSAGVASANAVSWGGTAITATSLPVTVAAGASGGVLIAGSNAATTFATLTSTGAFTINGVSDVAQTGDSFARIGNNGSGLTSLAPASTALSTAQWTNTLATNLGTTNTTVANNLDVAVGSRMATYTQPTGFLSATFPTGTITNNTTTPTWYTAPGTAPTVGQIATAVWQDTTAGDFTVAGSIGRSLFTSGNVPGAASGLALVGSNMGTVTSIVGVTFPVNFSALAITTPAGAVTVGTNNDKTGYSLSASQTFNLTGNITGSLSGSVGSVTSPVTVGDKTGYSLSTAGNEATADALLGRNIAGGSNGGRTTYQALAALRNKIDTTTTPGTLSVYGTDDTTLLWSATLTTDPNAEPITASDPS